MNNMLARNFFNYIYIESSTYCNFNCVYCHRTLHNYKNKNINMSPEVFKTMINKLVCESLCDKSCTNLFLHGFGEPTINPWLPEFIDYAQNADVFNAIQFVSNLSFRSIEYYSDLLVRGLTRVYASFDSLNPDYVENIRKGSDFNAIKSVFTKISKHFPGRIIPITVLTKENIKQLNKMVHFFEDTGVRQWNIQLLNEYGPEFKISNDDIVFALESIKSNYLTVNLEGYPYPVCSQPQTTLVINVSGDVLPCCIDFSGAVECYGNALDRSIRDCIGSRVAKYFISSFHDRSNKQCLNCAYYGKK